MLLTRIINQFRLKRLHKKYGNDLPSMAEKECLICDYFIKYLRRKTIVNNDEDLNIRIIGECRHPQMAKDGIRISDWSLNEGCKFLYLGKKRQTAYNGKRIMPSPRKPMSVREYFNGTKIIKCR